MQQNISIHQLQILVTKEFTKQVLKLSSGLRQVKTLKTTLKHLQCLWKKQEQVAHYLEICGETF